MQVVRARAISAAQTALVAFVVVVAVAGCETVEQAGWTGMSVDAAGRPVVVFAVCDGHIDGSTIYRDRRRADPRDEDDTVSLATWRASPAIVPSATSGTELNTVSATRPWTMDGSPLETLEPQTEYVAYGWTDDNRWSTADVEFTLARLKNLEPGQVLTQAYDSDEDDDVDTVQSIRQFREAACS